jgi:hypothetical protein
MLKWFSKLLDTLSEFLSSRKGLLPFIGMMLILVNFILRLVSSGWLAQTDFFLHAGIILAILGFLFAWVL